MSDEPLFCPSCGAEDYGCACDLDGGLPLFFCELSGARLEACDCPEDHRLMTSLLEAAK